MKDTLSKAQPMKARPAVAPPVDIYENESEYLVLADLPGVAQQDLTIKLESGELSVEGRWSGPVDEDALSREFQAVDFRRAFSVPHVVNADAVVAELKDGVLSIHLPKSAAYKPREVPVQLG